MPFGILDTKYIDLPPNIDVRYIETLRTRAGVDFAQILRELDSRLGALNTSLDPMVADLITTTTADVADGGYLTVFEITERGERTIARPQLAEGAGHMLALRGYDVSLEFTEDGLQQLSLKAITRNIDSLFLGMRRLHRKQVLKRLFDDSEIRVNKRTTATSPGFAGSGTGGNEFNGTFPDGVPLPGGYTHYYRDTVANLRAVLKAGLTRLRRWWTGPFDLVAPQSMIDLIVAFGEPDFIRAESGMVRLGANYSEAILDQYRYVGVFDRDTRIHTALQDFSDPNIAIYKTFGAFNPQNPLVWKYDELKGRDAIVRSRALFPLDQAVLLQDFGININNRVAAVLFRIDAAGGYVAPTFNY